MLYTVFDIETTGINPAVCEIVQFSYLNITENNKITSAGCLHFYHEDMHWSSQAEAVHGLSQEYLSQFAADFYDNIRRMYVILQRCNGVGHNSNSFDFPFCRQFLRKYGMNDLTPHNTYDTMQMYRPVYKKAMKLMDLAAALGISDKLIELCAMDAFKGGTRAHDSRFDTMATSLIFAKARKDGIV